MPFSLGMRVSTRTVQKPKAKNRPIIRTSKGRSRIPLGAAVFVAGLCKQRPPDARSASCRGCIDRQRCQLMVIQ